MGNSVSVIIPTWNRSDDTLRAVRSVLNQTYNDFEIIIVDDGSIDQTENIFSEYPDKRVRYIQIEHSGLPAKARNVGINNAKGEWIAFLDSDDEWIPEKLAIQVKYFNSHTKIGLVCSNARMYQNKEFKRNFFEKETIQNTFYSLLLYSNFIITSSVLVKRSLLLASGGFSEDVVLRGIEDFDLWIKICSENPFYYLDRPLLKYNDQPLQSIRSEVTNKQYLKGMLTIYQSVLQKLISTDRLSFQFEKMLFQRTHYYRRELGDWEVKFGGNIDYSNPMVSIILPVYNGEKFILESVYSILKQTYKNIELIVVNDGSTDQTELLLRTIKDPRIKIISQENSGIVASLNKAITFSKGKYVARQDHDDIALPTRIEKQLNFLEENLDYALIGTGAEIWNENNEFLRTYTPPVSNIALQAHLLIENPFIHSSVMLWV